MSIILQGAQVSECQFSAEPRNYKILLDAYLLGGAHVAMTVTYTDPKTFDKAARVVHAAFAEQDRITLELP